MANELELIKRLEERIGKKLKEIPLGNIMPYGTKGYTMDENGYVVG